VAEHWKRSFNALLVAEFLAIAGFQTSTPILPLYLRDLGVTDPGSLNSWNGVINGFTSLALALVAPVWGSLADSYGKKAMLLRATIGGTILLAAMAFVTSPWQLLVLKILQGVVTGTVAAATVLVATIVPPEEAGYRLGLFQVSVYLGSTFGPLLGGVISDVAGNRVNFLATGVLLAIASFLILKFVREDLVSSPRKGSFLSRMVPDPGVLATNPLLAALLFCVFAVQLGSGIANPILPLIVLHLNAGAAGTGSLTGLIIGAGSLSGALAAAFIGRISGRFGYRQTLVACLLGAVAFTVPQGFASSPMLLLVLRIGSGAFLGGTIPSINALLAHTADRDKQGAIFGLSSSVSSGGMAIGPILGALVANLAGYPAIFFTTAAILFATALLMGRRGGFGDRLGQEVPRGKASTEAAPVDPAGCD
jgi:DHA1 family multidrug resistance protein-like MFS transporter